MDALTDARTPIEELKELVRAFCEERDWDQFHNAKDLAIGISTEAAELLEEFRFLSQPEIDVVLSNEARRKKIEQELADVLIFLLRFGQRFGFDLASAVGHKLRDNARRYPVETSKGSNAKAGRD